MKYLLLIFPALLWSQITVTPISHYPTTGLKTQLMLISQDTPSSPVIYKKFTAGSLRAWIDSSAMDSAGCQSKVNCDSTGTGKMVRQNNPTITGVLTNTGRDTTVGNIASAGNIKAGGTVSSGGNLFSGGYIITAAPASGSASPWKLGTEVSGTCHADTTRYIQMDVSGTAYKLSICQ